MDSEISQLKETASKAKEKAKVAKEKQNLAELALQVLKKKH